MSKAKTTTTKKRSPLRVGLRPPRPFRPTKQPYGMRYPNGKFPPPKQIPAGAILVHNPVSATRSQQRNGDWGFRFFYMTTQAAKDKYVVRCACGWAPHLPVHYRLKGSKIQGVPKGK